jgi:hypothetical protein
MGPPQASVQVKASPSALLPIRFPPAVQHRGPSTPPVYTGLANRPGRSAAAASRVSAAPLPVSSKQCQRLTDARAPGKSPQLIVHDFPEAAVSLDEGFDLILTHQQHDADIRQG